MAIPIGQLLLVALLKPGFTGRVSKIPQLVNMGHQCLIVSAGHVGVNMQNSRMRQPNTSLALCRKDMYSLQLGCYETIQIILGTVYQIIFACSKTTKP